MDRIPWDDYFISMLPLVSQRSHDAQTKIGAILVRDKSIISTGYNGFIRGVDDKVLPNTRPGKYLYIIHAEKNLILNCARAGISTQDTTLYLPCEPCIDCYTFVIQAGITRIVYSDIVKANMGLATASEQWKVLRPLTEHIGYEFISYHKNS